MMTQSELYIYFKSRCDSVSLRLRNVFFFKVLDLISLIIIFFFMSSWFIHDIDEL